MTRFLRDHLAQVGSLNIYSFFISCTSACRLYFKSSQNCSPCLLVKTYKGTSLSVFVRDYSSAARRHDYLRHCCMVFTVCGLLIVLHFDWRYSPTAAFAVEYLTRQLQQVSDVDTRQRLRSSSFTALVTSCTSRTTIGGRCFSAAATLVWDSLPEAVHSSASLA